VTRCCSAGGQHQCRLYRSSDIPPWSIAAAGNSWPAAPAAGPATATPLPWQHSRPTPTGGDKFLDQETGACAEPGTRGGGGTHRLFADHTHRRITGGSPPTRCVRPENHELVELRCPGLLGEQPRLRLDPLGVLVARGHPNKIRAFMWVALFDAHRASDQGVRPATGSCDGRHRRYVAGRDRAPTSRRSARVVADIRLLHGRHALISKPERLPGALRSGLGDLDRGGLGLGERFPAPGGMRLAAHPFDHVRVVQLERGPFGPDPRQRQEVVPRWW